MHSLYRTKFVTRGSRMSTVMIYFSSSFIVWYVHSLILTIFFQFKVNAIFIDKLAPASLSALRCQEA